jgi:hypothetical protein
LKEQAQERLESFAYASTKLSCCSDTGLQQLLSEASRHHSGIGGSTFSLQLEDMPIFVKKIPLTDIERLPENVMSTANLFNLPPYYQYGIGSVGFSAWRELIAHIMTSNWLISEASTNFPLLYHWRILPNPSRSDYGVKNADNGDDDGELEDIESQVKLWGGAPEIRNRLQARRSSTASIVLFLEHFPITLYDWLGTQLADRGAKAELIVSFLDEELRQLSSFTSSRGLVHFDNHFKNILTGGRFALSDFGLTLSKDFELSESEREFLDTHSNYDRCSSIASLVHFIIQFVYGGADWKKRLQECLAGDMSQLTEMGPSIADTIKKYAPIAEAMVNFNRDLQHAPRTTTYPKAKLDELLLDIDELNV